MIHQLTLAQIKSCKKNKIVPRGKYEVDIESIESNDKDLLVIKYRINKGDFRLKKIFDVIKRNDFTKYRICRILNACGIEVKRFAPSILIGRTIQVITDEKCNVIGYEPLKERVL